MKKIHAIALVAASAAFFSFGGAAMAQNVSGADPYQQGFAAGASAKEQNSFNAFDSGYRAGQTDQVTTGNQAAGTLAYANGYQAGMARANSATQEAYNEGYQARAQQDQGATARAFDDGFDTGAYRRARDEADYP
jgi:hypothetical protein